LRVVIDFPETLVKEISFGFTDPEMDIKFLLAVKLVEIGRISTGRAAEWLGIPKPLFLQKMGHYGLSALPVDAETLKKDIMNVRESSC